MLPPSAFPEDSAIGWILYPSVFSSIVIITNCVFIALLCYRFAQAYMPIIRDRWLGALFYSISATMCTAALVRLVGILGIFYPAYYIRMIVLFTYALTSSVTFFIIIIYYYSGYAKRRWDINGDAIKNIQVIINDLKKRISKYEDGISNDGTKNRSRSN